MIPSVMTQVMKIENKMHTCTLQLVLRGHPMSYKNMSLKIINWYNNSVFSFQSARLQRVASSRDGRLLSPSHRLPPVKSKKKAAKRCFVCAKKTGLATSYICRYSIFVIACQKLPWFPVDCHILCFNLTFFFIGLIWMKCWLFY